jgi:molybdopterin-guanine dinucleotide biosynthesis protein B
MSVAARPPVISIVGRKNSGKTTLTVALAAELRRRGLQVASMKHGHHEFEIDRQGSDSWRHFHEGGVEAVLYVTTGKVALIARRPGAEPDPEELIRRYFGDLGLDLVLVEGYKHGPFPKIEIHRREVHDRAVYDPADAVAAALFLAIVTDDARLVASCPVITLDPEEPSGSHVNAIADLIVDLLAVPTTGGS